MKQNIIVTGSAGLIGSKLVKTLRESPYNNIFEIDRKYSGEVDSIDTLFKTYKIDVVYHLAAQTSVFNTEHEQMVKDNICAFVKIVDLCKTHGTKLIYASSSTAFDENTTSLYGLTKKFNEDYARLYCPTATGVRLHNVYDETNPREGTLLWHIFNDDIIRLYNKGENKRYFTHINDAVKGLILATNSKEKLVNCFSDKCKTLKEFVNEHNIYNKKVELLNEIRDLDVFEQKIDTSLQNILNAES